MAPQVTGWLLGWDETATATTPSASRSPLLENKEGSDFADTVQVQQKFPPLLIFEEGCPEGVGWLLLARRNINCNHPVRYASTLLENKEGSEHF